MNNVAHHFLTLLLTQKTTFRAILTNLKMMFLRKISFINSTATEECKMINTTHKIPALFHYDIKLKHTFSQLLQQEIFLNSTQTKIKTTSCQILPSATIPA